MGPGRSANCHWSAMRSAGKLRVSNLATWHGHDIQECDSGLIWLPSHNVTNCVLLMCSGTTCEIKWKQKETNTPARWWRSASMVINNVESVYPWYDVMNTELYHEGFIPSSPLAQAHHEKNSRRLPIMRRSAKYLTNTPQNYRGHQKQGKPKKLSQPKRAQETRQFNVMRYRGGGQIKNIT